MSKDPTQTSAACTVPEDWRRCRCDALTGIAAHNSAILAAARIVDGSRVPAERWHGRMRRELLGYGTEDEAVRYKWAFDWAIKLTEPITEDIVGEIHERAVGGRCYRQCHLWVSNGFRHPEPPEIGKLMEVAFYNYAHRCSSWPSPARALGLHLDILTAHPFRDGNGRTARITAAAVLVQAGFRSTVFTSVDRHIESSQHRYLQTLDEYRFTRMCRSRTVELLVAAMRAASPRCAPKRHGQSRTALQTAGGVDEGPLGAE